MKKSLLLLFLAFAWSVQLDAQNVGIGTTTPTAKLEVVGKTKTTDLQMTAGAAENRVMKSDSFGNVSWVEIDSLLDVWGQAGNLGTNPNTEFIGTLDSVGFTVRTSNFETGRFLANPPTAPGIVTATDRLRLTRRGTTGTKHSMSASFQLGSYATGINALTQMDIALGNGAQGFPDTKVMTLLGNGNVGIGNTAPHGILQFSNGNNRRKVVLYEKADNQNQFMGLGRSGSSLMYQIDTTTSSHLFLVGNNSTTSTDLMIIKGTGTVGIGTSTPSESSILALSSSTKGVLMPRMTTAQRDAIVSPAPWLQILNVDDGCTDIFDGAHWIKDCGLQVIDTVFDLNHPTSDSWTAMADFGSIRSSAVSFSIGAVGYMGTGWTATVLKKDFWEFNPATNTWTQKADFGGTARRLAIGFAIGTKGFVGTGSSSTGDTNDFWEYNPSNNTWTQKANFSGGVRSGAFASDLGAKGFVGTGRGSAGYVNDWWEYNPANNTWTAKTAFPGAARAGGVAVSLNGKLYAGTGNTPSGTYFSDWWEYDPIANTWTEKLSLPGVRTNSVVFSLTDKMYVSLGKSSASNFLTDLKAYDPVANTWTSKTNFPGTARSNSMAFSIGSKAYVGTGASTSAEFDDVWEYMDDNAIGKVYQQPAVEGVNVYTDGKWTLNQATGHLFKAAPGNVGIGTTTPNGLLQFANGLNKRKLVLFERQNNVHQFTGIGRMAGGMTYQVDTTSIDHIFYSGGSATGSNELMRIRGNGNVGIGTSSPQFSFVATNDLETRFSGVAQLGSGIVDPNFRLITAKGDTLNSDGSIQAMMGLGYVDGALTRNAFLRFHRGAGTSGGFMSFTTGANQERMRIDGSGFVGIGTTTPNAPLQFGNGTGNRKLVLFEVADNNHQYFGFGINTGIMRYQVSSNTADSHVFFAGVNSSSSAELMRITGTGRVGIGVSAPDAPLHIVGVNMTTPSMQRTYFREDGAPSLEQNTSGSGDIAVHADGWYWADGGGFVATSDRRIKNVIGATDTKEDLATINSIEVTDYTYIDQISNSNKLQKKVIAQQLQDVYPHAVNQLSGVIPNVFEVAQSSVVENGSTTIITGKMHDFASGDEVKLILEDKGERIVKVTVIDAHTFTVADTIAEKVFVYGKKVNDLLNVDYDAVSMLNVSATQELSRQVDALKAENEQLKITMNNMILMMSVIEAKVNAGAADAVHLDK